MSSVAEADLFVSQLVAPGIPRRLLLRRRRGHPGSGGHHTAKWFLDYTHLPDSALLKPLAGERTDYGIIDHGSSTHYRKFLPHFIFRRSFRRCVLAVFESNGVAAQPILYRWVPT